MPRKNGHATDLALATKTLSGDLRDYILTLVKNLPKPWAKMSEGEQRQTISDIAWYADNAVRRASALIAAEGFASVTGTIDSVKTGKQLEMKIIASRNAPGRHEIFDAQGSAIIITIPGAERFIGERKPAKATPDQPKLPIAENEAAYERGAHGEREHKVTPA